MKENFLHFIVCHGLSYWILVFEFPHSNCDYTDCGNETNLA